MLNKYIKYIQLTNEISENWIERMRCMELCILCAIFHFIVSYYFIISSRVEFFRLSEFVPLRV